jgi:putative membrane protein
MYHDMFFGGMWFGWLFWIIIIALIAWIVMGQVNRSKRNSSANVGEESPMDILNKRLARGEISAVEYEEIKKKLK